MFENSKVVLMKGQHILVLSFISCVALSLTRQERNLEIVKGKLVEGGTAFVAEQNP
jgi:hypothetical protein